MRPDMDDYAEIDETKPASGSRAMSWMVLAVAVGGFSALAYYAYNSGANVVNADDMMTIEADATPIKQAPSAPDGAEFPNQDKTIYDVISPNSAAQPTEKLLPEPEHPVTAARIEDSEDDVPSVPSAPLATAPVPSVAPTTNSFVAEPNKIETAKPIDTKVASAATNAALAAAIPAPVTKPADAAQDSAKPVEKSFSAPEMINEKPAPKPVVAVNEKTKAVAKPKADKPAATAGGAYKVQLGAFKSEEEALVAWKKISGAHSRVLSGAPTIVKAEVNGGTFYRLRAGSYASADAAKAVCAKLSGQACFPAK